ncbi:DNA adenine methylase [Frankia sp. Cppng1_Ct_nod]|uniref:DNA adenine methylase n=1 Tax=Frankia sp. Cppng1_Ct_nod TaxID=2897162 RepID=UPI0010415250|nr:DNA adenine methylase [Frankia sp. Cppng1_Ct_nod]
MTDVLPGDDLLVSSQTNSAALAATSSAPAHIVAQPRALAGSVAPLVDPSMATMRYQSPLRYPGAKAGLAPIIIDLVEASTRSLGRPQLFVEPFAGGASASLRLAGASHVDRILLADADPLVARFWQVAAADTDWLIDRMYEEPVTLARWDYWRSWAPRRTDDREIAVKCLFLNRTTFSGILHGRAGPIGGRAQTSEYAIDCRFNKDALERRLRFIGDLYTSNRLVDVWCKDWEDTLADVAEYYPQLLPNRVIAYLDPPYLRKSHKLYGKSFDPAGGYTPKTGATTSGWMSNGWQHLRLAEYLRRRAAYRWILSYDNEPELTSCPALYAANRMTPGREDADICGIRRWRITKRYVHLRYTVSGAAVRSIKAELLLTTLPPSCVPVNDRLRELENL